MAVYSSTHESNLSHVTVNNFTVYIHIHIHVFGQRVGKYIAFSNRFFAMHHLPSELFFEGDLFS